MAKRLSEKEKLEIVKCFTLGKTIDELSSEFDCTKITISRNLKLNLGESEYKKLFEKNRKLKKDSDSEKKLNTLETENKIIRKDNEVRKTYVNPIKGNVEEELRSIEEFIELTPLNFEIQEATRKDLSSIPISDIKFPKLVYMIVNKNIELETKYLKDFPDWQFLSEEDLNRKAIEIHFDLKIAKRLCNKEQKVIKVPNTQVFKIVAPILLNRGISRIVSDDKLIAL